MRVWIDLVEKIAEQQSRVVVLKMMSQSELRNSEESNPNQNVRKRIKYTSYDDREFYVCAFVKDKIVGITSLMHSPYKSQEKTLWLMGIGVDETFRNQGIAELMLDRLFQFCQKKNLKLQRSSPTDDGAKYLPSVYDRLSKTYSDVVVFK